MSRAFDISEMASGRRRRKRRLVAAIAGLAAYAAALLLFWVFTASGAFDVKHIKIEGAERVPQDQILSLIYGVSGRGFWGRFLGPASLLTWPSSLGPGYLKLIPEVKSISVEKDFRGGSATVVVEERSPRGIWCSEPEAASSTAASAFPSCLWFDDGGELFRKAVEAEGGVLAVVHDYSGRKLGIGDEVLPAEMTPNLFSVMGVLKESGLGIKELRLRDIGLQEIEAQTYAGPAIYFSLRYPADSYLDILKSFASSPNFRFMQYVDFRSESRAYYK